MNFLDMLKIAGLYLLVASSETLNGILRTIFLNKRLGVRKAKKLSIVSALILCLMCCYFYVPLINITTNTGLFLLGISLSVFMLLFDILLGKFVIKLKLSVILDDLNLLKGNLLGIGLILMAFCPLWSAMLHRYLF